MWKAVTLQVVLLAVTQVGALRRNELELLRLRPPAIDPATLDPTDFDSAVTGYTSLVDSRPYADFVTRELQWFCPYHLQTFLLPTCGGLVGTITDPEACCKSMQAMINREQGDCLCEHRIQGFPTIIAGIALVAGRLQCPFSFPIPQAEPSQLGLAIRASEECRGRNVGGGTLDNIGTYLGLSPEEVQNDIEDGTLPAYKDVYLAPPPGPYSTSFTTVNITRPSPSSLINDYSTAEVFGALIVYPSDAEQESKDPTTGAALNPVLTGTRKFPVLAYSPGFATAPEQALLLMSHMASQGIIVIAQRSTSEVAFGAARQTADDWARDIAYGIQYLKNESAVVDSFLYERVDADWVAIAGHSFGAIFTIPAAAIAAGFGIGIRAVVPISPTCLPFSGVCDTPGDADLNVLNRPKFLIITGRRDTLAIPSHGQYIAALLRGRGLRPRLRRLRYLDHCLAELNPTIWPFSNDCGNGNISPWEQARRVHELVGNFLARVLRTNE